jgi:hypothetical protein
MGIASVGYIVRPCLKTDNKQANKEKTVIVNARIVFGSEMSQGTTHLQVTLGLSSRQGIK